MFIVLFIVGPPGSGKSEVYRIIRDYLHEQRVERINDYAILTDMCDADVKHEHFLPTPQKWHKWFHFMHAERYKGFTVIDDAAFDEALQTTNRDILDYRRQYGPSTQQEDFLLVVEFSRNDYYLAFQQIDEDTRGSAFFLLLSTEKEESRRRLKKRIKKKERVDNHYVPSEILKRYYDQATQYTALNLLADFGVPLEQVEEIDNNGTLEQFSERIHHFIDSKIRQRAHM